MFYELILHSFTILYIFMIMNPIMSEMYFRVELILQVESVHADIK